MNSNTALSPHRQLSKNLRWLLEHKQLSANQLAIHCGVPQSTVSRLVSGAIENPRLDTLRPIASYLGVGVAQLIGELPLIGVPGSEGPRGAMHSYPLISWRQAGLWSVDTDLHARGYSADYLPAPKRAGPHAFWLQLEGDSMEPMFPARCLILVEPDLPEQPGDYVVARREQGATFKQLVMDGGDLLLKPCNDRYPISVLGPAEVVIGPVHICVMRV